MTNKTHNRVFHDISDIEIHVRMFECDILDPPVDVAVMLEGVYYQLQHAEQGYEMWHESARG